VGRARDELYQGHWMQVADGDDMFRLHPLIQQFFVGKMREAGQQEALRQGFVNVLMDIAREIPEQPTRQMLPDLEKVIPHLKIVTEKFLDVVSDDDLVWSFIGVARFYEGQGLYGLAEPWYERCVEVVQSALGEDHPDYAMSLNCMAILYRAQGWYGKAEPLYRQSLEIRQSALGKDHPDYADSLNALAGFLREQNHYSEAELLYRQSLEIRRSALGEDHLDYAASLNNLALLYHIQGRYGEAEPLYRQSLEIMRSALGEDHPSYATSLHNLAAWYDSQGRCGEAEPLYRQSLEIYRSALGEDHPSYATSLNNLAALYYSQGRYGEAEPLYRQSLEIRRSALGEDHPDYATSLGNLAGLYSNSFNPWKWLKACQLSIQTIRIDGKALGWKHPSIQIDIWNLLSVCLLPAIFIWILSQGLSLSLKTHSFLPMARSIFAVLLLILINRSSLETRFWAKAKHKLSQRKQKK
jgi:tetratricopeptide (TPR) repeat protein